MVPGNARAAPVTVACVLLLCTAGAAAFYVPGVHPVNFVDGDPVLPRVGRVSSVRKHVPYDYYDLPSCQPPDGIKNFDANLGEVLRCAFAPRGGEAEARGRARRGPLGRRGD